MFRQSANKLVKQQYLLQMSSQYGERRPTNDWDRFISLGHSRKFQQVSHLGSVTARHSWCCLLQIMRFTSRVISHLCVMLYNNDVDVILITQHAGVEFLRYRFLYTVVQAVVKAMANVIIRPRGSKTRSLMTFRICNYVPGRPITAHANVHGAAITWAVSANTWLVIFRFLSTQWTTKTWQYIFDYNFG